MGFNLAFKGLTSALDKGDRPVSRSGRFNHGLGPRSTLNTLLPRLLW